MDQHDRALGGARAVVRRADQPARQVVAVERGDLHFAEPQLVGGAQVAAALAPILGELRPADGKVLGRAPPGRKEQLIARGSQPAAECAEYRKEREGASPFKLSAHRDTRDSCFTSALNFSIPSGG